MKVERALQGDHSDYMRVVASFADEETAQRVCEELVQSGLACECCRLLDARVGVDRRRTEA